MQHLVGRPYAFPCQPPDSFDCWQLVRYVRMLRGLASPLPFDDRDAWCRPDALPEAIARARASWRALPGPAECAMAVLEPRHVGVVIDGGVLHAGSRQGGVVWTSMAAVRRVWPRAEWWEVAA
jgi:hypothetical protein